MFLPWIWGLLCLAIAVSGEIRGDSANDDVDKIEEEIVKEGEGGVNENGYSSSQQYEGKMEKGVDTEREPQKQQDLEHPGNSKSIGKVANKDSNRKSANEEIKNKGFYVTKYLYDGRSDQKKQAKRGRVSGTGWEMKGAKSRENDGTKERRLNKYGYSVGRYRKKDLITKKKLNQRKSPKAKSSYKVKEFRSSKYKWKGNKEKEHAEKGGSSRIFIKHNGRKRRTKTMQMQNKRRKRKLRRGQRGRRTRRMILRNKRIKSSLVKRKNYPTKYRYNTGRYSRFEENKTAKHWRRNRNRKNGRRRLLRRNGSRRYSYMKGPNGKNGRRKERFKVWRSTKGPLNKYGKHINRYKSRRKTMQRKTKGQRAKIYSHRVEYGRKRMKNHSRKKGRKRKGHSTDYGMHNQRYRKYRGRKRFKIHIKSSPKKKRKGMKSRLTSTNGNTGNSRCTWRVPKGFKKQFLSLPTHIPINQKHKLTKCSAADWYGVKFGAEKGYKEWIRCLKKQGREQSITAGRYERNRKHRRCGKQQYNPDVAICCNGNLHKKAMNFKCCGSYLYNVTSNFCWNNTIFDSVNYSLCNSSVYNHMEQFCFNGSIYDKTGRYGVCCTDLYYHASHYCYNCKVYKRCCYSRCGKEVYYTKQKLCFHECLFDRQIYNVCAGRVIKRSKYKCVDDVIKTIDQAKPSDNIARKREFQVDDNNMKREDSVMDGKRQRRSTDSACQEMIYH